MGMVGKRIRTSPILLDFQGVPGFVLIITYGHTFATLALQNGVDVKTVSSMLGHYDAGFTLRTYTHATRQQQNRAAETMGNFMAQVM
jgi:integrase